MSRDFLASQLGREFKPSPNRDRITRASRQLQNFFFCGSRGNENRLIQNGNGNLLSKAFNPPDFWRGSYLASQFLSDRFSVINYPNEEFGLPFAGQLFPIGTKLAIELEIVGFSTLYDPDRRYIMGKVTSGDPDIGIGTDIAFPGQQLQFEVDVNYVDRGSVAFLSLAGWRFPSLPDDWSSFESTLGQGEYTRERINIGGVINGWVLGNALVLNKHNSYNRKSSFWRKTISTTAIATRLATISGAIPDFRPLNQSKNRPKNSSAQWEITGTALSTNMVGSNPVNPLNGSPVFNPLNNAAYDPKFTEIVWGRFTRFEIADPNRPMLTTWTEIATH